MEISLRQMKLQSCVVDWSWLMTTVSVGSLIITSSDCDWSAYKVHLALGLGYVQFTDVKTWTIFPIHIVTWWSDGLC